MPEQPATAATGRSPGSATVPPPAGAPRRLLVVMPSWVGDCVMATPLLRAIRAPRAAGGDEAFLAAYLRPHLVPLFEPSGLFDACIGGRPGGLLGPGREARRLRGYGFDAALLLPNSFRAAWLAWLARIPRRVGFDRDRRGRLLSEPVPCPAPGGWNQPMPLIDYYLELAASLGVDPPGDTAPRLVPAAGAVARARTLLAAQGLVDTRPVALINPGASKAGKRWPAARFAALADSLHDSHGMQIVINGSPDERALTGAVAGRIRRAATLDLAQHETTLATLAAMCGLVDLVVTNDTGTRHIAAAVGFQRLRDNKPAPGIVTIFGTVRPEWTTLSYPGERELFQQHTGRVEDIGLEQVTQACRDALTAAP